MSIYHCYVVIRCDGENCKEEEESALRLARPGHWDDLDIEDDLRLLDWTIDGDKHYCEECSEKRKGETHGTNQKG